MAKNRIGTRNKSKKGERSSESRSRQKPQHRRSRGQKPQWRVRRYREGLDGVVRLEFEFPIEGGARRRLVFTNGEFRRTRTVLDTFANYSPIYPDDVSTSDQDRRNF